MTAAAAANPTRLRLPTKLAFGVGSVAFGVKDQGFSAFLLLYYNQVLGLPASWVGIAIAGALVADAFLDPIIGYVSDHWHSRLGRRHPFLYASALPLAVSYVFLWNPPRSLSHVELTAYLIGMTVIVRTFISIYEVPSAALIPELTSGYHERTSVISYRFFFGTAGAMGISILALSVFMKPDAVYKFGQLNPAGYVPYSYAAAVMMFGAIVISALGTQRRVLQFPVRLQVEVDKAPFDLTRSLQEIKATVSNRGVLPIFGAGLFGGMAGGVGIALLTYIYTYFWELSANQIAALASSTILSSVLGVMFATRVSTRFGKRNTAVVMHLVGLCMGPAPLLLRLVGWFPKNGSPLIVPILYALGAVGAACAMIGAILWYSMTADVVEDSQLATGRRSEGLLFASNAFVLKCVSGLGLGVSGIVLNLVAFPEHAMPGAVPQAILTRLALVDTALVGVFYLAAIGCLAMFPISEATHRATLARLSGVTPAASKHEPPASSELPPVAPPAGAPGMTAA